MSLRKLIKKYSDEITIRYYRSEFRIRKHFDNDGKYLVAFLNCPLDYSYIYFGIEATNGTIVRYYTETGYFDGTKQIKDVDVFEKDKEFIEKLYKEYTERKGMSDI